MVRGNLVRKGEIASLWVAMSLSIAKFETIQPLDIKAIKKLKLKIK